MSWVELPILTDLRLVDGDSARPGPQVIYGGRPAAFLLKGRLDSVRAVGRSAGGEVELTATTRAIDFRLGALWARERIMWLEDRLSSHAPLGAQAVADWLDDDK